MVGYFIGYSTTGPWYCDILGNTVVTSVHIQFDGGYPYDTARV